MYIKILQNMQSISPGLWWNHEKNDFETKSNKKYVFEKTELENLQITLRSNID